MGKEKLWTGSFLAACGANFLMFFAFYMLLPILPMYLAEQFAVTKSTAGLILSSYTIMALLFRPFAGFMVDSFPRKPLLLLCYTFFISYFGGYMLAGAVQRTGAVVAAARRRVPEGVPLFRFRGIRSVNRFSPVPF